MPHVKTNWFPLIRDVIIIVGIVLLLINAYGTKPVAVTTDSCAALKQPLQNISSTLASGVKCVFSPPVLPLGNFTPPRLPNGSLLGPAPVLPPITGGAIVPPAPIK